jgi:hypothetical protein
MSSFWAKSNTTNTTTANLLCFIPVATALPLTIPISLNDPCKGTARSGSYLEAEQTGFRLAIMVVISVMVTVFVAVMIPVVATPVMIAVPVIVMVTMVFVPPAM